MARSATPAATTPGSVTMKTRCPPAAAMTSASRRISPTPNSTRFRSVISMCRSASPLTTKPSAQDLEDLVHARIASDRQPAPTAMRMEPPLGRRADRVLKHPRLVEVTLVRIRDRIGHVADLAAERELLERTAPAARAVEPQHQR